MNKKIAILAMIGLVAIAITISLQSEFEENKKTPISVERTAETSETNSLGILSLDLPILGSTDATITIFAFNDYQCKGCKSWYYNTLPEIKEKLIDTGKANLVFVDMSMLGDDSLVTARAAYCADDQNRYWDYQEMLFSSQGEIDDGWASIEQLKLFAIGVGLDLEQFESCVNSTKHDNKILSNIASAKEIGIALPSHIMISSDGKMHIFKGGVFYGVFEQIINTWL